MQKDDADIQTMTRIAAALDELGIAYHIGGSVACGAHGDPRSTNDLDIVADIRPEHAAPLTRRLEDAFYIDEQMILDAIAHERSFNVMWLEKMYKVDVFVLKSRGFDQAAWQRSVTAAPFLKSDREFPIASAEDILLNKLEWFKIGGEISERQWLDVIGVLRVQRSDLDWAYLRKWAAELEISDLLEQAHREAEAVFEQ